MSVNGIGGVAFCTIHKMQMGGEFHAVKIDHSSLDIIPGIIPGIGVADEIGTDIVCCIVIELLTGDPVRAFSVIKNI